MTTTKTTLFAALTLALGALATGCAAEVTEDGGDGSGSGVGTGSDDAPKASDVSGTYRMQSQFDIATNMPGKIGEIGNQFIAATDDPDDPTNWMLDQIINNTSGTTKTFLQNAKPFVAGYLNDRLLDWAPDFFSTMVVLGNDFGEMTKHFGLVESLEISKSGESYMSTHTVTGAHFKIDNQEADYMFADYGTENVSVAGVGVTLDATGRLGIADHTVPLSYGKVLRIGLDAAIIPMLDSSATDLNSLFAAKIDCYLVGQYIAEAIGFGSASTYNGACAAGLNASANYLYSKIADIDSDALEFGLAGTARAVDSNNDGKADKLQTGTWAGELSYAGTPAPLAAATFFGERQ